MEIVALLFLTWNSYTLDTGGGVYARECVIASFRFGVRLREP